MKLALIGCGSKGDGLAAAAQSLGHDIVLCADASPAAAKRAAATFKARSSAHPLDALEVAEALLFCNPTANDAAIALRALHAGLHVYWGAPLTHDPRHARSMLDAAKSANAVLFPQYPARECPQFAATASQTANGAIGPVGFVRVHRRAAHDATSQHGAALDALSTDIDWIAANFGAIDTVFAQIVRDKSVDAAMVTLTTGKGPIVQCVASLAASEHDPGHAAFELCGESGMIQFNTADRNLSVASHSARAGHRTAASSPLAPPIHVRRARHFFELAESGRLPAAQLKHEMHIVRIVETALESATSGRAIKVSR